MTQQTVLLPPNQSIDTVPKTSTILKSIASIAVPCSLTSLCECISDLLAIHFVSLYNNTLYLGAVGMGMMWSNITTNSIVYGFSTCIQTLCSQTHGSKQYYLCGVYHLRARIIMLVMSVLLSILAFFSESIFKMIGVGDELAHHSAQFSMAMVPANIVFIQASISRMLLQSMKIVKPATCISVTLSIVAPALYYLFVNLLQYHYYGIAIVALIRGSVQFVALFAYIRYTNCCKETWFWFNSDCFKEWGYMLKLGFYGVLMVCFEWWAFELTNGFTGIIGTTEVASNTTVFNVIGIIYRTNAGIMESTCTLVGNAIGSGKVNEAKRYAFFSEIIVLVTTMMYGVAIITFMESCIHFYTHDPLVENLLRSFLIYAAIFIEFGDCTNGVLSNVLKSLAMQKEASIANFISYYLIMLPIAAYSAFGRKSIRGVWAGIIIGTYVQTICYSIFLLRSDWKKLCAASIDKLKEEKNKCTNSKS